MSCRRSRLVCAVFVLTVTAILLGTSGVNCSDLAITLPIAGGGAIQINTVTIELFNGTAYPVDPRLFVDSDDDSLDVDDHDNSIYVAPIDPGQVAVLTLPCGSTGAIETDHALMLIPFDEDVESDNDPIARYGDDFDCGDVVRFAFIDEPGEDFRTFVEVNGYDVD